MKQKLLLNALLLALLALIGCKAQQATQSEKVLNLGVKSKIKGMDPIYANDKYSGDEVLKVYEGLLEYHHLKRPYTLVPNLAVAMPTVSQDGLTYTFKIKKGVLFHHDKAFPGGKGRELKARDFVYSIKRLADPKLNGLGWWVLKTRLLGLDEWRKKNAELPATNYGEEVAGLKALDDYTLQFKLNRPFPQFLYALAMSYTFAVPREVVEFYGKEFLNHPVGTGPFILPEFKQTGKIVYTKNPTFRKKLYPSDASPHLTHLLGDAGKRLPLVDKVVVNILVEDQPRWLNFKKGKTDYIIIPKDSFDIAIGKDGGLTEEFKKKGYRLFKNPMLDVTYVAFNHDLKLFQNLKLRRAMMLAYNIDEENKLFYHGAALPAQSVVPPGIAGHDKDYVNPYRKRDLVRAKKLLAEAGYPEGKGLPKITIDASSGTTYRQRSELFKKNMADIGIDIVVRSNTWPELNKKILQRKIMLYSIAWLADYPDAENFLQLLYGPHKSPGANASNYNNPEFNEMFKKASAMQDSPARTALYEKMVRFVAEQVPWVFGAHRQEYAVANKWLKNYIMRDMDEGSIVQYLSIDSAVKKEYIDKL